MFDFLRSPAPTPPAATPDQPGNRRLLSRLLLIPAIVLAVLVPAPAQAQILDSSGTAGPVHTVTGSCTTLDAWGQVGIATTAPQIWARNNTAGVGNDYADVRWRSVLFDSAGRQVSHGWSEWARAWDNAPAAYHGAQTFRGSPKDSYRLRIEVQWWRGNRKLGAAWLSTDAFTYYKGGANYGVNDTGYCYYLHNR